VQNMVLEFDQFVRSVQISRSDLFSFFLGAGASANSGIKTANECIWEWKRDIYLTKAAHNLKIKLDDRSEQVRASIQKWLDSEGIYPSLGSSDEYSAYVGKCYPIEDDRRKYFQRLCEKKEPSVGYKLLSLLHQAGLLRSVWTTNFDDLVRDAAIRTGSNVIDIGLDSVDRIIRPMNNTELLLIKLHGDYKYGPLKNTSSEIREQDETFRDRLISYLNDKHLIVSGYSGRDESIMNTLMESYLKKGSGRLYWCGYGVDIPENVKTLLEQARTHGREAYYVPTDGFDRVMISLGKACADSQELNTKFFEYLKAEDRQPQNSPFEIQAGNVNAIIKSNLFPIKLPQEAFQFQSPITSQPSPWKAVRESIKDFQIVAVPYKGYIWALGTLSDINKCFANNITGSIIRVPLTEINLWKDSAVYNLMLAALTRALSSKNGLRSNHKGRIWKSQHTTQKLFNDILYTTHQAVRLSLTSDGRRHYLSLMPDFHISTETPDVVITKDVKQEIGRTYFDKLRNNAFDSYILEWRRILFTASEDKLLVEYPPSSASGFSFEIFRLPLFSKISKPQSQNSIALRDDFPRHVLHFNGIQYPEPELVFSNNHPGMQSVARDFHPMRGLTKNRPYDSESTGFLYDNTIRLGVICSDQEKLLFSNFLRRQLGKVSSNEINKDYLIDYPGFHDLYGVSLNIPESGSADWLTCPEPEIKQTLKETAFALRNKIIGKIDQWIKDDIPKVVIIFIPERWLGYTSFDEENERFDLHDYIKAYCAEKAVATQFIQEDTVKSNLQCQINWWLSLSYYVKSLRTPWILEDLDKNTAFAGIGYSVMSRKNKNHDIVLGCSHIYNSQGQGLKYKLSKVEEQLYWDGQDNPHLSYNDAFRFGISIKELFYKAMNELPKRVVVHKRTYFTTDEINGLRDSLLSTGVQELDLIEINFTDDIRFLATKIENGNPIADNFAVPRGTCIQFDQHSVLLWTHGIVPSVRNPNFKYYLGGRYIPGPLRITKHLGNSSVGTIAKEVLGLTKMNWNSFDMYSQLPATVNSSNEIARIGRLLLKREGMTYDYRYFI
jgi:NAD-dependent SIR2 family protein deacetylase